jgi:hypothetical protein
MKANTASPPRKTVKYVEELHQTPVADFLKQLRQRGACGRVPSLKDVRARVRDACGVRITRAQLEPLLAAQMERVLATAGRVVFVRPAEEKVITTLLLACENQPRATVRVRMWRVGRTNYAWISGRAAEPAAQLNARAVRRLCSAGALLPSSSVDSAGLLELADWVGTP